MQYLVEFMEGETVKGLKMVEASTPFQAATIASSREIIFKIDRSAWVRVTVSGRKPFEFGYANY